MRSRFDEQLAQLNNMLIEMGALIERAILMTTQALTEQDSEIAIQVIDLDEEVDQKEKDIEAFCLKLLLQQQPVASDLRLISACLKMITDMERIADQASDISEISIMMAANGNQANGASPTMQHIPEMADATIKMVTWSIDAFVKKDIELAKTVVKHDDVVDRLFDTVKYELIELIQNYQINGELAIDLIMIAKYFERIGDHAVNIAEWVAFSITGKHVRFFPELAGKRPWEEVIS
ncbi:MAG: phosphate signaling complex protein PhoU [Coriobacteriia bacterium]|nr:phosphate signaling complex protein PhoU [Coriobacteriia bacterium]